jgi:hypothetical protein
MIPVDSIRHAPAVGMLNHLIWFLKLAIDEDQDEQYHYCPGASFFIQGVVALREPITVVGDARWEKSTEHCRAFSDIAMQLLHYLGAIFHRWIIMGPVMCIGNRGLKEYVLIRSMITMGKVENVTTLYAEWLKEVKNDTTTHSRWAGDTVPPVLLNFPAHLIAPKNGRGNGSQTRQARDRSTVSPPSLRDMDARNAIAGGCTQPWHKMTGLVHSPIQGT